MPAGQPPTLLVGLLPATYLTLLAGAAACHRFFFALDVVAPLIIITDLAPIHPSFRELDLASITIALISLVKDRISHQDCRDEGNNITQKEYKN